MTCGTCGAPHPDTGRFCPSCGAFLEWDVAPAGRESRPAEEEHQPVAREPSAARAAAPLVERTLASVAEVRRLAGASDRADLVGRLGDTTARLRTRTTRVVLVGAFKEGKSTLVNALLRAAVCPTDVDVVTAVPTVVRYGDPAVASVLRDVGEPDRPPVTEPVPLAELAALVTEDGNPGNHRRLRSVEVRLPHRLLAGGLVLVDTPGVGGLDSAHGVLSLAALDDADAALFVTDASAEFTAPEMEFLRTAVERCPSVACVVTKTDLHPQWRRIVERDAAHLRSAGLDLPLFAVSSFVRLLPGTGAADRAALLEESGFRPLAHHLARTVVAGGERRAVAAARADVRFVAAQLGRQVEAERAVVADPGEAPAVVERLVSTSRRTAGLLAPGAGWQQRLTDGVQDLVADVDHDLQARLRRVLAEADRFVDACDPQQAWAELETWLRRETSAAALATYEQMREQTRTLSSDVADAFDLVAEDDGSPDAVLAAPVARMAEVTLSGADALGRRPGQLAGLLLAGRTAAWIPLTLVSAATAIAGAGVAVVLLAPVGIAAGAVLGRRIIRDERSRQLTNRRQQAKAAVRRYVDDVGFLATKECRDALRRTGRTLRDEFTARAAAVHRSSTTALTRAEAAGSLDPASRRRREAELAEDAARLRRLSRTGGSDGVG